MKAIHSVVNEWRNKIFLDATELVTVHIPSTVTTIGENPFVGCASLTNMTLHQRNKHFKIENDTLFDINQTRIISYFKTKDEDEYIIPESVIRIENSSISKNKHLKRIRIPQSVTYIGENAFFNTKKLQTVKYEGKRQPETCHETAFNDTHRDLIIQVPIDYEGDTFCGKQVKKQK